MQLTPYSSDPVNEANLDRDIRHLLANDSDCQGSQALHTTCVRDEQVAIVKKHAIAFRKSLAEKVQRRLEQSDGGRIAYHDEWHIEKITGLSRQEIHTVTFRSLVQRPDHHPSNIVTLTYIEPARVTSEPCHFDTAIFLHGASENTLSGTQKLARIIADLNGSAAVVMTFPQFGARRLLPNGKLDAPKSDTPYAPDVFNTDYLTVGHKAEAAEDIGQTLLDLHLTIDFINSLPNQDHKPGISLVGLSLGSFIGILYEGIDPGRVNGGDTFYASGGDIAHAFTSLSKAPRYQDDYFVHFLKTNGWDEDQARKDWAHLDAMTWAGQIHDRKMLLMSPKHDEVFVRQFSYDPVANSIKAGAGNHIEEKWLDTPHNPEADGHLVYVALNFFLPILEYQRENIAPSRKGRCAHW